MSHKIQRGERVDDVDRSRVQFDFLGMVRRRKWYLVGALCLSLALGLAYISQVQPSYQVEARILVQHVDSPLDQGHRPKEREHRDFLATQAEIISSPAVVKKAVDSLGLTAEGSDVENPVSSILAGMVVRPVLGTNVLSIQFSGTDADQTVATVDAVIAAYREYLRTSERASHIEVLRLLGENEKEMRSELQALEEEYREMRRQSPLLGQGRNAASVQRSLLTHLGRTLTEKKTRRIELENQLHTLAGSIRSDLAEADSAEFGPKTRFVSTETSDAVAGADIQAMSPAALVAVSQVIWTATDVAAHDVATIREQLYKAKAAEKAISQTFGHKHPDVKAAAEQIASWEELLRDTLEAAPAALQHELDAVRRQEERLAAMYEEEYAEAKVVDGFLLQEQQKLDNIHRVQEAHQQSLAQMTEWQLADKALAEGRPGVKVRVLEAPALAGPQTWPPPALLMAFCAVAGLVMGFGVITILERTDTKVRSSREIGEALQLPVVGRIPVIPATPRYGRSSHIRRGREVAEAPGSPTAEAFRALRTRLEIAGNGAPCRVIQVTSPKIDEGKTTVTANLAFSFAQLGKRVVVVDADLRNGCLGQIFGLSGCEGLTSVLREGKPLKDVIERSTLGAVDVLARGPAVPNPADMLAQPEFDKVLDILRQDYDVVLVDSPPLLAAAEASLLASKVDGVILSAMMDQSSLLDAQAARELLDGHGAIGLGIVLNQVPAGKQYDTYDTRVSAEARELETVSMG